ncbi:FIST signal transduction protein [Paludibacterium paludis]|uniref:Histidine kinase n=1 Tax=Paludibacterium paludis TaxID=1225769 RepID=A0A918NZC8_9NEIS|nr:FIST N-terminal domain-containing protein [Paludibacterium paludis]GGY07728.1 hypothetical protein GCM10011289_07800 [Paludibacterium paludis]
MKIHSQRIRPGAVPEGPPAGAGLALVFADQSFFADAGFLDALGEAFAGVPLVGCSTAGEILGVEVTSHTAVIACLVFGAPDSRAEIAVTRIAGMPDSQSAGERLGAKLPHDSLAGVLLFGTGVAVNGSALVAGLAGVLPRGCGVFGGLAGDNGQFVKTWTLADGVASDDTIVAVGLYGSSLRLGNGSYGGWEPFGPLRKVTRAEQNMLYELDGERALDIYRRYLGEYAADLPGSGLLFPFEMQPGKDAANRVIRTILGIDEQTGALLLAGDVDPDGYLRLMHASTEHLIAGAGEAALLAARSIMACTGERLALLVSCVGRRLVMGERVDEEVEEVAGIFGASTVCCGFYSNGEISPVPGSAGSLLCNQTMTITLLGEAVGE